MLRILTIVMATVLATLANGTATAPVAYAEPNAVVSGDVTGVRGDTGTGHATFTASGSPSQASGSYTFTDTGGATFTGEVTCLYRELYRVVLTGPITGSTSDEAFVLWIQDNRPDAFDAAISSTDAARQCQATNFALNRFDELPSTVYYVVTSGDIVIGTEPSPEVPGVKPRPTPAPSPEVPGVKPQPEPTPPTLAPSPEVPGVEPRPTLAPSPEVPGLTPRVQPPPPLFPPAPNG
jgi:hypothetical protein